MKKTIFLLIALMSLFVLSGCFGSKEKAEEKQGIQTVSKGYLEELKKQYAGKTLVVNFFAAWCAPWRGETPDFVKAYEKYKDQDFLILDFPCNQFGKQAPGSNEDIALFCDSRYGITFPIFSKIDVNGEDAIPLFQYLKEQKRRFQLIAFMKTIYGLWKQTKTKLSRCF